MASSSTPGYTVFISHAGEDKATIAVPLREKLKSHGITAFVDEKDMRPGTNAPAAMTEAMKTAKIAVIVLSPEFIVRTWPIRELLFFLRRREETTGNNPSPVIIPFFYRLSISELYFEPRFDRVNSADENLCEKSRFFERMDAGEVEANPETIKDALLKVREIMGVRNDLDATNESSYVMYEKREVLLDKLCKGVREASPEVERRSEKDEFRPYHYKAPNTSRFVFNFLEGDENEYAKTQEGELLKVVEDLSTDANRCIALHGIGGVGKTSALQAISELERIKQIFEDGIHLIRLGMNANEGHMISALITAVKNSGGHQTAYEMRSEEEWRNVIECFCSWFAEKRCLFLVDDIHSTKLKSGMIQELLSLHQSGRDSKVMLTTRSLDIAFRADTSLCLEPRLPLDSVARVMLTRYAGIEPNMEDDVEKNVVNAILEMCCGLPLFLAIAGRAVRKLKRMRKGCKEGALAYYVYSKHLEANMAGLLNTDVDSCERLESTLSLSIELIEPEIKNLGFSVSLTMAKIHRRLSVLEKEERVPMSMLQYLWELSNESEAAIVAGKLEEMALVDMEIECDNSEHKELLSLHDSLHLFASSETRKRMEEQVANEALLDGYGESVPLKEGLPMWWSSTLQTDGYMPKRLCKRLLGAGRGAELVHLLLRPQWAERQLKISGTRFLKEDFSIAIKAVQDGMAGNSEEERSETEEVLQLISDAITLSSPFISKNPAEVCFQLHGRLKRYADQLERIREYVSCMEAEATWPAALCLNDVLGGPGGANTNIISTDDPVYCMVMFGDGERVACGSYHGSIRILNIHESEIEKTWKGHVQAVLAIAVRRNGTGLVTGSWDRTAKVWDAATGQCVARFEGHTARVFGVAVLKDDNRAVSVSEDGSAQVWEMDTGRGVLPPLTGHEGWVTCVAALGDRDEFITGGADGKLRLWSATSGDQVGDPFDGHEDKIYSVDVTLKQRRVVSGSRDRTIRIWDVDDHKQIGDPITDGSWVLGVAMSSDGSRIVSGSQDRKVRVWGSETRTQVGDPLQGHGQPVLGVSFLASLDSIVSCSSDGTVRVWDTRRNKAQKTSHQHNFAVAGVAYTPNGQLVVSASHDKTLRIWSPTTGQRLGRPLTGHSEPVNDVTVTPDGRCVVSVSEDKTVGVWDLESGTLLRTLIGHTDWIWCVVVTPNGAHAVTGSKDKTVRVWDLSTMDNTHVVLEGHSADVSRVFVTDDGSRIVSVDGNDEIFVWDLKTYNVIKRFKKKACVPWSLSRLEVLNLVGETTVCDNAGLSIPLGFGEIVYGEKPNAMVLATLESPVLSWALSPDKKTICLGLVDSNVAFLKLKT